MKPKLRFKGYEEEWKKVKLGEIADVCGGGTPSTSCEENWGGNILWFTPAEVGQNKYLAKSSRTITQKGFDESSTVMLPSGTILLSSRATIGEASIAVFPCTTNQGFQSLIPKETTSEFVYALVNTLKHALIKESNGSTFLEISGNKVRNLNIKLPSSSEQTSIGEYFKHLDEAINKSESEISKLKQIKKASLQSMFPQPGETKPKLRFKGFNDDWKEVKLGDLGDTYSGLSGKDKDDFGVGDAKYITFLNVLNNACIDTSALEHVNVKNDENQNQVHKGDLFFNTSSETPEEVGMCSVLLEDVSNVYLNSFCFGFRPTTGSFDIQFFSHLMRSEIGRNLMKVLAQGATRYNLSKANFSNSRLAIPASLSEQQKIGSYFSELDSQISLLSKKLEKLKQVKKGCLAQMFV